MNKEELFQEYINKYAVKMNISEAEAQNHKMVKQYKEYLEKECVDECEKTQKSIINVACGVAENCES